MLNANAWDNPTKDRRIFSNTWHKKIEKSQSVAYGLRKQMCAVACVFSQNAFFVPSVGNREDVQLKNEGMKVF